MVSDPAISSLKAVADPVRLRILHLLFHQKEMCVCQFAAVLRISYTSLSKHLQILKQSGLVLDERRGRWVYYSLVDGGWNPAAPVVLHCVRNLTAGRPYVKDLQDSGTVLCCDLDEVASQGPAFFTGRKAGTVRS